MTVEEYLKITGTTPREFREMLKTSDPKWIKELGIDLDASLDRVLYFPEEKAMESWR